LSYLDTSVVAAFYWTADEALAGSAEAFGVEVQILRPPTEA
jgi:hypothetical protein